MAKVKAGVKGLSRDELADKGDAIKTAMTGNANFTTPNPPLTTITTQVTTLRAKIAAINSAKAVLATAVADADAAVNVLSQSISNPPTQAQVQAIQNKINELINAITRPLA